MLFTEPLRSIYGRRRSAGRRGCARGAVRGTPPRTGLCEESASRSTGWGGRPPSWGRGSKRVMHAPA